METTAWTTQTTTQAGKTPERTPSSHTYYSDTGEPLTKAAPNAKYNETSELRTMTPIE